MKAIYEVNDKVVRASISLPTFIGTVTTIFLFSDLHRVRQYLPELIKQGFDYDKVVEHFDAVDGQWRDNPIYVVDVIKFFVPSPDCQESRATYICCEAELLPYQESIYNERASEES